MTRNITITNRFGSNWLLVSTQLNQQQEKCVCGHTTEYYVSPYISQKEWNTLVPLGSQINQQSPTFLAPGIGFVEDNFSMDWEGVGDGSGGDVSNGERQMKLRSLACRSLPLRGPVPNRSRTATWSVAWGLGTREINDDQLGELLFHLTF